MGSGGLACHVGVKALLSVMLLSCKSIAESIINLKLVLDLWRKALYGCEVSADIVTSGRFKIPPQNMGHFRIPIRDGHVPLHETNFSNSTELKSRSLQDPA